MHTQKNSSCAFAALLNNPLGSEYKVDASYLSPNVNMASRLEAATKQYGVPLLLSQASGPAHTRPRSGAPCAEWPVSGVVCCLRMLAAHRLTPPACRCCSRRTLCTASRRASGRG